MTPVVSTATPAASRKRCLYATAALSGLNLNSEQFNDTSPSPAPGRAGERRRSSGREARLPSRRHVPAPRYVCVHSPPLAWLTAPPVGVTRTAEGAVTVSTQARPAPEPAPLPPRSRSPGRAHVQPNATRSLRRSRPGARLENTASLCPPPRDGRRHCSSDVWGDPQRHRGDSCATPPPPRKPLVMLPRVTLSAVD